MMNIFKFGLSHQTSQFEVLTANLENEVKSL